MHTDAGGLGGPLRAFRRPSRRRPARTNARFLFAVGFLLVLVGCGGEDGSRVTSELAPIESADVRVAESFPPQYFLDVVSGLPSGCASFDRSEVSRSDDTIEVRVWNRIETPQDGACTAIYGTARHSIALGSDFETGRTYTVHVNTMTRTFTAQ